MNETRRLTGRSILVNLCEAGEGYLELESSVRVKEIKLSKKFGSKGQNLKISPREA